VILASILAGMVTAGFVIAALFFLRFWRDTRDTLFLYFAAAFLVLGISQLILALGSVPDEYRAWVYLGRLAAFLLIAAGILRKNQR
jgi:uncharacterized membrane protein HdeD (DUF308 family)